MKLAIILTTISVVFIVTMGFTNFQGKGIVANENGYVEINLGEVGRTKSLDGRFIVEFNNVLKRNELAYSGWRPRPRSTNVGFLHFRKQATKVEYYTIHIDQYDGVYIAVPNGNWVKLINAEDKAFILKVIDYKVGG